MEGFGRSLALAFVLWMYGTFHTSTVVAAAEKKGVKPLETMASKNIFITAVIAAFLFYGLGLYKVGWP